jgi:hypothetical protein
MLSDAAHRLELQVSRSDSPTWLGAASQTVAASASGVIAQ